MRKYFLSFKLDQILTLLHNISTKQIQFEINEEDEVQLLQLFDVYNELKKTLVHWQRNKSKNTTVCTVLNVNTVSEGNPGRPKISIRQDVLEELRGLGFSWEKIAKILNVSRWTVLRRVEEFDLHDLRRFTDITDEEVDNIIKDYMSRHGATTREQFMSGFFRSKGIVIQRRRI